MVNDDTRDPAQILLSTARLCERSRQAYFAHIVSTERLMRLTLALSPTRHAEEREAKLALILAGLTEQVEIGCSPVDWPAETSLTNDVFPHSEMTTAH